MKKIMTSLLLLLMSFTLVSCASMGSYIINKGKLPEKGDNVVYETKVQDGLYTAFETSIYFGALQITWVDVRFENNEIISFNIDEVQMNNDEGNWNKSKKELGFDYGMQVASPIDREWIHQAYAIEDYLLVNGVDSLVTNDEGYVDISGATMIATSYINLAKEAIENASEGKFTSLNYSLYYGSPQVTWVDVYKENGKIIKYYIDELQSADGAWNEKTKKELKEDYNMKPASPIDKEWYEQALAIENYMLAYSPEDLELDEAGYVDINGATMIADSYIELALESLEKSEPLKAVTGTFTAFEVSQYYGSPQVTWVDVTMKNGKPIAFNIDERQVVDGVWSEKTKKELKEDYNMKPASPIDKEWYEQAEAIEAFFLEHGPEKLVMNDEGYVEELAGATMIADSYVRLALEAIRNAKQRKHTSLEVSFYYGSVQVSWVDVYVVNDEVLKYNIDELQSVNNVWNEHTKKQLGDKYNMKPASPIDKEWFEQAKAIEDFFLEFGPENLVMNDNGFVEELAGATMVADNYVRLALDALAKYKVYY